MATRNKNAKHILLFLAPAIIIYIVYFIYPLGFVMATSFTDWDGISAMKFNGIRNYINLFTDGTFIHALRNNIIWALSLGFIQIPLATAMALILARKPKGWKTFRTMYFLPNVISQVALAMMWLAIYNADHGLLNNLLVLIGRGDSATNWLGNMDTALMAVIIQQLFYIGYFMIVILASRMNIPTSYYEAAEIDGASIAQQEWSITLPMLKDILITTITLALAYGMRHFESTYLMTNGGPAHATDVLGILLYRNLGALQYGEGNAIGTTLIIFGGATIVLIRHLLQNLGQKEA
jgi:raffinose/stachyose/melibiose transport system permease protein